jgi:hypothetical protein
VADLIGDDRPPSRRVPVLTLVLVVLLGGYAGIRHLSAPQAAPADAAPTGTATPTPPATRHSAIPSPYSSAYPASAAPTPVPRPWAWLAPDRRTEVDFAAYGVVHADGRTYRLGRGDRVLTLDRASRGPVVLVQSRGSTVLEQLRPDGSRLVLDTFTDESRHPQGVAVDPSGSRVAYALAAALPAGPFGLMVRDLSTGEVLADLRTSRTFGVRDWTASGVVLTVARDPGGPPYRWMPGAGPPERITPFAPDHLGPYLLAASPVRPEWAVTAARCTGLVRAAGRLPVRLTCREPLGVPAAWSPSGGRIAARGSRPVVLVLDLATGRTVQLGVPSPVYIEQIVWRGDDSVLVAVHTLAGDQGAVLRCRVGGDCRRLTLGAAGRSADLVLAG